jgi:DNA-binding response OmpR family regulator
MKILLAEDDTNVSMITQLCLERIGGHQVTVAFDGAQALAAASGGQFDLIILDGMMPKLAGLDVARELLNRGFNSAPIIFLSAKSEEKDIKQFLALGNGFIAKPFDPQTICALIDDILKEKGQTGS